MKRFFSLFRYELKYAFIGMRRHFLLCLSAISAVAISLVLIVSFVGLGLHVDHFASHIESDLSIHVVLDNEIKEQDQIQNIEQEIENIKNVDTIKFSDKDKELELMIDEKGEAFEMYRGEVNPLSHAFFVYVKNGDTIEKTAKTIEFIDGISSVAFGGDSVNQLIDLLSLVRKVGYGVAALLLMLSLYLIYNTVRTTIYSRADEIIIMRTVGATNAFIRIPFETQGIFIGLIGAILPLVMIIWGYPQLYTYLNGKLLIHQFSLIAPDQLVLPLSILIAVLGALIGWFASIWAVSKYLKQQR